MIDTPLFRLAWLLFIGVTCAQAAIWNLRSKRFIAERPELAPGYSRLIRGLLVWGNLPWVVWGIASTVGGVSFMELLNPLGGNPYVLVFFTSTLVLWALAVRWLYFGRGAEELAKHPGLLATTNPVLIKLYFGACLLGGVAGMVALFRAPR
jgi:hypothetical protein